MPECPECNGELVCPKCAPISGVSKCPSKGALWVQVHDGDSYDAKGVKISSSSGQSKTTDGTGLAAFDPLDAGTYSVELVSLPEEVAKRFDTPDKTKLDGISVSNGKIAQAEFVLRALPKLKVTLSPTLNGTVKIAHEEGQETSKETTEGVADFGTVAVGKYTITVTLDEESSKGYAPPTDAVTVELAHGEEKSQELELRERPRPVIEPKAEVVAVGGEGVQLTVRADQKYGGKGVLRCSKGGASIEVKHDEDTLDVAKGAELADITDQGVKLQVTGLEASELKGVVLEWTLVSEELVPAAASNEVELTVVSAQLTIHDAKAQPIDRTIAQGDGRVLPLQDAKKERPRAKLTVTCKPLGYAGKVSLDAVKADLVALYGEETEGEALDLPHEIAWPKESESETIDLWVEGKTASANKSDGGLKLKIVDLADDVDNVVLTVLDAKIVVCEERPKVGEPPPLGDTEKRDPGRALFQQGHDFLSPRALVRVTKVPHDTPCTLQLKASGDQIRLFPKESEVTITTKPVAKKMMSCEHHVSTEKAETLPRKIAVDEITDPKEGLVFWAEGAAKTDPKLTLTLAIDDVDDAADHAVFTVGLAKFEVDVTRVDKNALSEDVTVELREKQGGDVKYSGKAAKATGKVTVEAPPGAYLVGIVPDSVEKTFRVLRDKVDDALETPVRIEAKPDASTMSYKLEPEPTYTKIQFVAYRTTTGKYLGEDDKSAHSDDAAKAAKHDIAQRCKIMTQAVKDAVGHTDIDGADTTLKIFMAPEFYFRGRMGAYPYESVSQVLDEMRTETNKDTYEHWLFVFGSALGCLELEARKEHAGTAVKITGVSTFISFLCGDTDPTAGVASGWELSTWNKTGTVNLSTVAINAVTEVPSGRPNAKKFELVCAAPPKFDGSSPNVWISDTSTIDESVYVDTSTRGVRLETKCTAAKPAKGWGLEQGALKAIITKVNDKGSDLYEIFADFKLGPFPTNTNVTLIEPGEAEIINVAHVQKGGAGVPMNKDGSRALKELLVYKETISSVDFMGLDYGTGAFYSTDRHLAELDGDPLVKLYPTPGSTDVLSTFPNKQGKDRVDSKGVKGTGKATEITESGLGGGTVFTMHDITFGLEVCLDHGAARLKKYYDSHAKSGEPKVQVQLIPSCGMSIDPSHCCAVGDGLVFNVDAHHHAAKKSNGSSAMTATSTKLTPTVPGGITITNFFPDAGEIEVYPAENTPTKANVP